MDPSQKVCWLIFPDDDSLSVYVPHGHNFTRSLALLIKPEASNTFSPFTFLLMAQKEVDDRYATPRPNRPESMAVEAATRNPSDPLANFLLQ